MSRNCAEVLLSLLIAAPLAATEAPVVVGGGHEAYRQALLQIWPELAVDRNLSEYGDPERAIRACEAGTVIECDRLYLYLSRRNDHRQLRAYRLAMSRHAALCAKEDIESCTRLGLAQAYSAELPAMDRVPNLKAILVILATTCTNGSDAATCLTAARLAQHLPGAKGPPPYSLLKNMYGRACRLGGAIICDQAGIELRSIDVPPYEADFFAYGLSALALSMKDCDAGKLAECLSLADTLSSPDSGSARDESRAREILTRICRGDTPYKVLACDRLAKLTASSTPTAAQPATASAVTANNIPPRPMPAAVTKLSTTPHDTRNHDRQAARLAQREEQLAPLRYSCLLGSIMACAQLETDRLSESTHLTRSNYVADGSIKELFALEQARRECRQGVTTQCQWIERHRAQSLDPWKALQEESILPRPNANTVAVAREKCRTTYASDACVFYEYWLLDHPDGSSEGRAP